MVVKNALCTRCGGGWRGSWHPWDSEKLSDSPKVTGEKRAELEASPALLMGLTEGCFGNRKCWGRGDDMTRACEKETFCETRGLLGNSRPAAEWVKAQLSGSLA